MAYKGFSCEEMFEINQLYRKLESATLSVFKECVNTDYPIRSDWCKCLEEVRVESYPEEMKQSPIKYYLSGQLSNSEILLKYRDDTVFGVC